MTTEGFARGGEFTDEAIALESRFPQITMPIDNMWPLRLHDEATKAVVAEVLPELVTALSEPIPPVNPDQLHGLFATNPHNRRTGWLHSETDEGLTYSTAYYEGQTDSKGSTPLFYGINYTFDQKGRLAKREYVDGDRSYNALRPNYQEFLTYDEDGYLTQRTTWGYIEPTVTDSYEYEVDEDGHKTPSKMTRVIKSGYGREDSEPMVVDLGHYEEWLETNPNGFSKVTKEQLESQELTVDDFSVEERRRGILFSHPEQLEHALVMYGDGTYPTPGGETALEYNDKVFAEGSALGGALFSLMSRSGNMRQFVQDRIMEQVTPKWNAVQKSRKADASESVHFSFDYDGAGHFHKSNGEVRITKQGVELTLSAAYVGDQVEDQLAGALGVKRGLRSASIEVPVNQTAREGYFLVDIKAACDKLGVPVTDERITEYMREYLGEGEYALKDSYDRHYGRKSPLWQDAETGVEVDLVTQTKDYDSDTDLDDYFDHDATSMWGPLPKNVRKLDGRKQASPKIRVLVQPSGNPFDEETTRRTDDVVRSYMSRLQ